MPKLFGKGTVTLAVPAKQIAKAERWLREQEVEFRTAVAHVKGCYTIHFPSAREAVFFKTSWDGGAP